MVTAVNISGENSFRTGLAFCFSATCVTITSCTSVKTEALSLFSTLIRYRDPPFTSTVLLSNDAML